jgi:heavy metal translocating P-type ATPase
MTRRTISFFRDNPIPLIALIGLISGSVARWVLGYVEIGQMIFLAALVIGGMPLVGNTLRGMLRGQFAADVVAMLAIVTAVVMQEYFAGVVIVLMQSGGEALEAYGLRRASSSLEALLARAPRVAWRKDGESLREITVDEVRVGDTLLVRPGDLVPVDGLLLSDAANVDESALTGEPLARAKHRHADLLSGSINVGGAFEMRAEKVSAESQYAKIVDLVREAQEDRPPIQRLADRYAVWFTPLTLLVAAWGWFITGDARTILSVLVVATPCPLILATPIAVISGVNRAARQGIIVKGGAAIEEIARAQVVVFDKTGTLTYGSPAVDRVVPLNGVTGTELLRHAGSVEQFSSHLLARTLTTAAKSQYGDLPIPSAFSEHAGRGVEGVVDGRHVMVGSRRFLEERLRDRPFGNGIELHDRAGEDVLAAWVAIDHQPSGVVLFNDQLRPGVPELVSRLRDLGVRSKVMLTGDNRASAEAIAREAGIERVEANLLPEDKVHVVRDLKRDGYHVVMVGDGINDAPALATADVGVAMGAHGTGISAEAADVVLLVDDVTRTGDAIATGQRMLRIAKQSIYAGLGLSLFFMIIASFGYIPPTAGALIQEAIDVAVILNALRAR